MVDPAIRPDDEHAVASAISLLKDQAGRPPGREQAIALHDLAVLSYLAYLQAQDRTDRLELALSAWAEVTEGSQFWMYVKDRASEMGDQRLTDEAIERMRAELPKAVLDPLTQTTANVLGDGDIGAAAELTQTIRRSGLPEGAVESAVQAATSSTRARIQHGLQAFDAAHEEIDAEIDDASVLKGRIDEAEAILVEQVLAPVARLAAADPISEGAPLLDQVGRDVRYLSVLCANHLLAWERALVLIRVALETARSPHVLAQMAVDNAVVSVEYHLAEADAASEAGHLASAVAHFELAAQYAQDPRDARDWERRAS